MEPGGPCTKPELVTTRPEADPSGRDELAKEEPRDWMAKADKAGIGYTQ